MSLINDFWTYCSCYEIPRNYSIWSALAMVSAVANRKVFIRQGDIKLHANIYACLIGEQGGRKSTPKDFARDIVSNAFPDLPIGASMQSREEIIQFLSSGDSTRAFKDTDGMLVEYHPYVFFINELKNFLSFNPGGMIEFLTDIYDRPFFDARTLKRGAELIPNPSLTILACETPEWIIDKLKGRIISGGFSRRMLYIYEIETSNPNEMVIIPRPVVTQEAREAHKRVIGQLQRVEPVIGEFKWTKEAEEAFDGWYTYNKKALPSDPIMRGYFKTKDAQLLKLCMLLALSKPTIKLELTGDLFVEALSILTSIEENMPRLAVAAGRNELAVQQLKLLQTVADQGGWMTESAIMRSMDKDLAPMEMLSLIRFLKDSEQLIPIKNGNGTTVLATREKVISMRKANK